MVFSPNYRFNIVFVFLIFLLYLAIDKNGITEAKGGRGGGGRGGGAGGGGGRGSSGGGRATGNSGGSYSSSGGGGASFGGSRSSSGTKISAAQGALAGLAVGYVAGSVASRITSSHYTGVYGGRTYYYGDRYYPGPGSGKIRCSIKTPDSFPMTYGDTGTRISELIYECGRNERCCDDGCCSNVNVLPIVLAVIFGFLLIIGIAISCRLYQRKRRERQLAQQQQHEQSAEYVYPPTTMNKDPQQIGVHSPPPAYGFATGQYNPPPPATDAYPPYPFANGATNPPPNAYPQYPSGNGQPAPYYPPAY